MRVPVPYLLVAGVVTAVVVGGGVVALGRDDPDPAAKPTKEAFTTTPLSAYDATGAVVTRGPFCDAIDERQVEAVLGVVPDVLDWQNGDEVDLVGTGPDVVHEFGCRYAVQDVGMAQAWVFAPPVDTPGAERLVKAARKAAGCEVGAGPAFGSPTLALSCTSDDGTTRTSYRGLFGDAWLVCEVEFGSGARVAAAPPDVADVAGRWCVGVLQAARR